MLIVLEQGITNCHEKNRLQEIKKTETHQTKKTEAKSRVGDHTKNLKNIQGKHQKAIGLKKALGTIFKSKRKEKREDWFEAHPNIIQNRFISKSYRLQTTTQTQTKVSSIRVLI